MALHLAAGRSPEITLHLHLYAIFMQNGDKLGLHESLARVIRFGKSANGPLQLYFKGTPKICQNEILLWQIHRRRG